MLVRALGPEDAPAFRRLRLEALLTSPLAFGASHEEAAARGEADFADMIADAAPGAVFGAFDGNVLVGMAGLQVERGRKARHKGFLWGVFVSPAYRGQGVARLLVSAVIARARDVVVVLQSAVVTDNSIAVALYASLGFRNFGVEAKALQIDGVYYDEALIALDFSAA